MAQEKEAGATKLQKQDEVQEFYLIHTICKHFCSGIVSFHELSILAFLEEWGARPYILTWQTGYIQVTAEPFGWDTSFPAYHSPHHSLLSYIWIDALTSPCGSCSKPAKSASSDRTFSNEENIPNLCCLWTDHMLLNS